MIINALLLITVSFILSGCSSTLNMWSADSNMKKIELDMTKKEVIKALGNDYHRVGAFKTDDGVSVEILGYENTKSDFYILQFENGILKEWHKEMRPVYPVPPVPAPVNSESK